MLAAVIGLVGVVLGLMLGSGYTFWATYRAELANALVAVVALAQDLAAVPAGPESAEEEGSSAASAEARTHGRSDIAQWSQRVKMTWLEHRAALAQVMRPDDFRELARRMPSQRASLRAAPSCSDLEMKLEQMHDILWAAHEHFIVVSLVRMLGSGRVTNQIESVLSGQHDPTEPPQDEQG